MFVVCFCFFFFYGCWRTELAENVREFWIKHMILFFFPSWKHIDVKDKSKGQVSLSDATCVRLSRNEARLLRPRCKLALVLQERKQSYADGSQRTQVGTAQTASRCKHDFLWRTIILNHFFYVAVWAWWQAGLLHDHLTKEIAQKIKLLGENPQIRYSGTMYDDVINMNSSLLSQPQLGERNYAF